jgi:hypothetical protein
MTEPIGSAAKQRKRVNMKILLNIFTAQPMQYA